MVSPLQTLERIAAGGHAEAARGLAHGAGVLAELIDFRAGDRGFKVPCAVTQLDAIHGLPAETHTQAGHHTGDAVRDKDQAASALGMVLQRLVQHLRYTGPPLEVGFKRA